MAKNAQFRVLVAVVIGGIGYQPNDVVALPAALAKSHADSVDGNKEAVSYALTINGGVVKQHKDASAAQRDALEEEIAQLEASLAAADEADKPAIAALIEEKRAALEAL